MKIKDRVIILPDVHVPNHNKAAVNSVLKFIPDFNPTMFVQLGDFCDWDSFSSYDPRVEQDIVNVEDEVRESNKLLDRIDSVLPKSCKKVMIGGNHEARMTKYLASFGMSLQHRKVATKLKTWHNAYKLDERGYEHVEYGEVYKFGKVLFTHGWLSSGSHAMSHLKMFHKTIIYGHSHQFQVATGRGHDGNPVISASIGTLSNFNLSYLVGKPPVNWINMFATIEFMEDGTFTPTFTPIIRGRFIRNGIVYGA